MKASAGPVKPKGTPEETGPLLIEVEGEAAPLPSLAGRAGLLGRLPKPTVTTFGRADRRLLRIYRGFRVWLAQTKEELGYLMQGANYMVPNSHRTILRRQLQEEHARLRARRDALMAAGGNAAELAELDSHITRISMEQLNMANATRYVLCPATHPPRMMVGFGLAAFAWLLPGVVIAVALRMLVIGPMLGQESSVAEAFREAIGYLPPVYVFCWCLIGLLCLWRGLVDRQRYFREVHRSIDGNPLFASYARAMGQ